MAGDGHGRARELARWKRRVVEGWSAVTVDGVESDTRTIELGGDRPVSAVVGLGTLSPDDVDVQLVHGPVGPTGELVETAFASMALAGRAGDGMYDYRGSFTCERAGRYGFTVRVVPTHPDLFTFAELGRVARA
jgi:starch phosphorylase